MALKRRCFCKFYYKTFPIVKNLDFLPETEGDVVLFNFDSPFSRGNFDLKISSE